MRAEIEWIPKDRGGRSQPPDGVGAIPYMPEVRLPDAEGAWPASEAWSLIVERIEAFGEPSRWTAEVRFRVEEAPHELLLEGQEFVLYEGRKCVARGRITGDSA